MKDQPVAKKLPEFDPALVEIVERKLAPYRGRVSPEMLDHMRQEALVLLATHPYPAALVKQLTPPPAVQHSTSVPTGDAEAKDASATVPGARREPPRGGRGRGR